MPAGYWANLIGTTLGALQLGKGGPRLKNNAGTVEARNAADNGYAPIQASGFTGSAASLTSFPTLNQNTSGTAAGLSATLAVGSGGTGQTTAATALNALLPAQAGKGGCILMSDATNPAWSAALTGRNRIINGGMDIDQRNAGAAQTITAAAAKAYTVDRFYAYCTGANVTGQRVAGSGQSQYRYQFTGTGSVTAIGFGQRIEAANSYDLNGTTATLSVDLANALLTTVTWTASYANTTDTFGTLASPTVTQIATGTWTVDSTVKRYSAQVAIPAAATTGLQIVLSVGAQTSGTWKIGDMQLEAGGVATPFEKRLVGTELHLCRRYYQATGRNISGMVLNTTTILTGSTLSPDMRATPSITVSPSSWADVSYSMLIGSSWVAASGSTAVSISQLSSGDVGFQINGFTGLPAGIPMFNNGIAFIFLAEL